MISSAPAARARAAFSSVETVVFFGGDGGEDAGSEGLGHLDEEEAGAACAGVDEDLVAALDGIGGVGEIVSGDALGQSGGGLL